MKSSPTVRRAAVTNRQRAHGAGLREWLHNRAQEREQRRREKRQGEEERELPQFITLSGRRVAVTEVEWVHRHEGGRRVKRKPYINPARDARSAKSGRLRKELR